MGERFPGFYDSPANPWGSVNGVTDPEFRVLNTSGLPPSIHTTGAVKVSSIAGAYNTVSVTWPSVEAAVSYSIYAGFSPFISQAELKATQTTTTYSFQFFPSVPTDSIIQVWVRATFADTTSVLVQSDPATVENLNDYFARSTNPLETGYSDITIDNDYMRFIVSEVRRRALSMMLNDGEDFVLYPRRWSGSVCRCNQDQASTVLGPDAIQGDLNSADSGIGQEPDISADPQGDALHRCPLCFGTGIKGGYYYGQQIKMRYGNIPPRTIIFKQFAIDLPKNFNSWSVWNPRIHQHDIVRRVKTGEFFSVSDIGHSELRGVPLHQEAKLNLLPPGDARYLVTDTTIATGEAS